jgi:hypothetical protein
MDWRYCNLLWIQAHIIKILALMYDSNKQNLRIKNFYHGYTLPKQKNNK